MLNDKYVSDRRPSNLDDAPEFLNVTQVASAFGISRKAVRQIEASDPTFPRRRVLPFTKIERFSRLELQQWANDRTTRQELGA